MRILIADDEPDIRRLVGDFLCDCGHEVVGAADGVEALELLEESVADAILSDVRMPRMDGLDLLSRVRVLHPGIPVILMTGHGDEAVATAALQRGALDYLKKPIGLQDLIDCVERLDERRRLEAQMLADFHSVRIGDGDPREPERPAAPPRRSRLLVITADAATATRIEAVVHALRHDVCVAISGDHARQLFAEQSTDVVITDVELVDGDGIDLAEEMRVADPTMIPLIVSAHEDRDTLMRALEAGAAGYLAQPLDKTNLRRLINKALREHERLVDTRHLLGDLIEMRADLQAKIAERERYLSRLIDSAPFGIVSTDRDGVILTFNGKAEDIHGYTEEEMTGRNISCLFADEDDRRGTREDGSTVRREHLHKSGRRTPVLLHTTDVVDGGQHFIARLHVIEDRTEREQMESQLLQAERLSVLGQLAPRIAHEFKTPLQAILGNAQVTDLMLEDGDLDEARQTVAEIIPAVMQMDTLVRQMLDLGKPKKSHSEVLDLATEVQRMLTMLQPLRVLQHCDVRTDFDDPLPAIKGDPAQLEQVLRNLLINGSQALEDVRQPRLDLVLRGVDDGTRVVLVVRDTGCGIAPENLDHIFQPFFTTKPEGKGTGLGLPIVKTILDRHGASIDVASTPGVGTTFTVTFPAFASGLVTVSSSEGGEGVVQGIQG